MTGPSDGPSTTRRALLQAAGATTAAGAAATLFSTGAVAEPTDPTTADGTEAAFETDPAKADLTGAYFPQSVASGGPTTSGAILWTRIARAAYEPDADVGLELVAATAVEEGTDQQAVSFESPTARYVLDASTVDPAHDHTVQVDLDGELDEDCFYYYRFVYDGVTSRVGRFRTLPAADTHKTSLRLAVASCNNYLHGYFGGFAHIAEEDVDYLLHLGDLIYEYAGEGNQPGRDITLPSGESVVHTLADYRHVHRTYRADEFMQRALERHTLVHTWDDHEVVNNRWWNYEADAPNTQSHPYGGEFEKMKLLYARGIKAMLEYLPLRVEYDADVTEENAQEGFRLYRSVRFGDLAELFVTDERLYRSPPPEGPDGERRDTATPPSTHQDDPDRTMLGGDQRDWFLRGGTNPGGMPDTEGVTGTDATWKVWGNEVLNAALKVANAGPNAFYLNYDAWDGYEFERRAILGEIARTGTENFVTLTGDMHTYVAAYLKLDYEDLTTTEYQDEMGVDPGGRVGVELMTPGVSSDNLAAAGGLPPEMGEAAIEELVESQNPHVEWFNSSRWGYTVLEFTPDQCVYTAYDVDRSVDSAEAPKQLLRSYRVPEGEVELQEVYTRPLTGTVGSLVAASRATESDAPDGPDLEGTTEGER